jgi:hypothetical protein
MYRCIYIYIYIIYIYIYYFLESRMVPRQMRLFRIHVSATCTRSTASPALPASIPSTLDTQNTPTNIDIHTHTHIHVQSTTPDASAFQSQRLLAPRRPPPGVPSQHALHDGSPQQQGNRCGRGAPRRVGLVPQRCEHCQGRDVAVYVVAFQRSWRSVARQGRRWSDRCLSFNACA